MKTLFVLLLTAAALAASEPAPAAWVQETDPKPLASHMAQWQVIYANNFTGPWMPAPFQIEGRFSAGFMNELIKVLLQQEMEEHTTGDTPLKCFRFVQVGE